MKFIVPYYFILYKSFAKKLKHRVLKVSVVAYDKLFLNAHKAKLKITACPVAIRAIISNSNTRAAMCRT